MQRITIKFHFPATSPACSESNSREKKSAWVENLYHLTFQAALVNENNKINPSNYVGITLCDSIRLTRTQTFSGPRLIVQIKLIQHINCKYLRRTSCICSYGRLNCDLIFYIFCPLTLVISLSRGNRRLVISKCFENE